MLNSFVHTVMYGYYGLSALGPSVQKHLNKWKKSLTTLQLVRKKVFKLNFFFNFSNQIWLFFAFKVQFFAVMIHSIVNIAVDCSFPKGFAAAYLTYGIIITLFFLNFYVQSYINKSRDAKKSSSHKHD